MRKLIFSILSGIIAFCGASEIHAYNRVGISYNNSSYSYNDGLLSGMNFSTNGVGLNYIHGFKVSRTLPMYVEAGLNANFNFSTKNVGGFIGEDYEDFEILEMKQKFQNINIQIPVNFTYHFNIKDFVVAPYLGLNFRLNAIERMKYLPDGNMDEDDDMDTDWINLLSKDDMEGDTTWNVFQMGWHIGVGAEYKKIYLGLQYGTDFIPAYSSNVEGFKTKINTGNFRLTVGYTF